MGKKIKKEQKKIDKKLLKEQVRKIILYCIHIKYSFKNTIISVTYNNKTGELIKQWSTKSLKKTERRKNSTYNIQQMCFQVHKFLQNKKIKYLKLILYGKQSYKRLFIIRSLKLRSFKIFMVLDQTPIVFNGCRPKKKKRK